MYYRKFYIVMTCYGRQLTARCFDTGSLVELKFIGVRLCMLIVFVCMHVCMYLCMPACQRLFLFCVFGGLAIGRPAVQMVVPNISRGLESRDAGTPRTPLKKPVDLCSRNCR